MKRPYIVLVLSLAIVFLFSSMVGAQVSPVAVEAVTLSHTTLELVVGGQPVIIRAIVQPENATNRIVIWTSSNTSVATVKAQSDAVITPIGPGTAVITAQTEDGGFTATCTVTVREAIATPRTGGSYLYLLLLGLGIVLLLKVGFRKRRGEIM